MEAFTAVIVFAYCLPGWAAGVVAQQKTGVDVDTLAYRTYQVKGAALEIIENKAQFDRLSAQVSGNVRADVETFDGKDHDGTGYFEAPQAAASPTDTLAHLYRARRLSGEGAIDEYLRCLDHGTEHDEGFYRVRPSIIVSHNLAMLGQVYPRALDALRRRRDAVEKAVLGGRATREQVVDFAVFNDALREETRTLSAYDALAGKGPTATRIRSELFWKAIPRLSLAKRYAEIVAGAGDVVAKVDADIAKFKERVDLVAKAKVPEDQKGHVFGDIETLKGYVVSDAAGYFEALLGTGKDTDATRVSDQLVRFAPDRFTFHVLILGAARAGKPDIARAFAQEGLRALPPYQHYSIRESAATAGVTLGPAQHPSGGAPK
jgi:hypothetical protein